MSEVQTLEADVQKDAAETEGKVEFWFDTLKAKFVELEKHVDAFYVKEKKTASTLVRGILQDIRNLAKDGRDHVQETRNAGK